MKKLTVIIWLGILLSGVSAVFWYNDWVYNLPTPVPANYQVINTGKKIDLEGKIKPIANKPLFLHFFNPDCPCSRFNMSHFKSLIKEYSNAVDFAIVVQTYKSYTAKNIQDRFDLDIPVLFDTTIATTCGVYSTPQAVIIDKDQKLFYRGNYNRTRYCADKKTEFARMALDSLLQGNLIAHFDPLAVKSYGCQLPTCTK